MSDNSSEFPQTAGELTAEIKRLRVENKLLLEKLEDKYFGGTIRKSLGFIDAAAIINSVHNRKDALKLLLDMTMRVVNAEAASVILHDWNRNEMYFEEAVGEKAEEVKKFRFRPNEGIAGYCFTTGMSLAVSDVTKDSRFKKEISETIGMKQKALMAAPLIYQQEVIGVMEAVNHRDGGTFSAEDLEMLSTIANFASISLHRASLYSNLYALFFAILKNMAQNESLTEISPRDFMEISKYVEDEYRYSQDFKESIELANLVREISTLGMDETNLTKQIMSQFYKYFQNKGYAENNISFNWSFD